ncbi:hypothetical protein B0H16DRAFT_1897431 [Mycena metata]|uniref:JmjC domain-containing protein n=1 Tax=Mycena metata TaxID=1033252 RepID=A0AAD7HEW2_9AGAR|nr:hypothetical protein B0H16DRAFT_1897431 [Mycena metata]
MNAEIVHFLNWDVAVRTALWLSEGTRTAYWCLTTYRNPSLPEELLAYQGFGHWLLGRSSAGCSWIGVFTALKELDQTGVPPLNPLDLDGSDFRVALGLDPLNGAIPSNYNTGRAQAWACLLHFQVLDLILATDFPHLSEASVLTPLAPGFVNDKAARKVLNPLKTWQRQFKAFEEAVEKMPEEVTLPSSGAELREQGAPATPQAESLLPLMAYTKIRNISAKFLPFKNLQAAATALVWILELGSSVAPLRTEGGLLNIAPLSPVYTRYQSTGGTERMDWDPKLTPSQFLRPLSLALRISPVILCCSSDLSANHLDLEVEEEISHLLLAVNPWPPGLLFYEQCVYSLVRGSSGSHSAQQSITREHLNTLLCGRPDATIQDEQIFRDVITRYDAAAALAATDSTRPHSITAPLTPVTSVWSARVAAIPVHAGGHISRALSQMPSHRPPRSSSPVQMNLITDLTRSDILFMQPPTPISEESGANVHNDRSDDRSGEVSEITQDQPTGSYIISTAENLQEENIAAPTEITPNEERPSTSDAAPPETPKDPLITLIAVPERTQNADETFSDGSLSPVPKSDEEGAMDVDGSAVEKTDTTPRASTQAKRKSAARAPERQVKRQKATSDDCDMEVEDVPLGLDSEWVDPDRPDYWTRDLRDVAPIERADKTQRVTALLPDGRTERTFEYLGHKASQVEYRLIHDVDASMSRVRAQCSKNGTFFVQRSDGDPMVPPTENDSHLCSLQLSQWEAMSDEDRVKLWGTGTDLFIYGLKPGNKIDDVHKQITKDHRLDAPVEVQVQGLRVPPEDPGDADANVDYTTILRTTTLQTVLNEAEKANGLVLNALKLPSGQILHNNPLMGSGFDLELVAYRQTNGLEFFPHRDPPYKEMSWELLGLAHSLSLFHFDITATWIFVSGSGEKFWIRGRPRPQATNDLRNIAHSSAFENWQPDLASLDSCDYEIVALPAGTGIFLQQPGREHAVISTNTAGPDDNPLVNRTATSTLGGYFFCASPMRSAICITLHMVMLQTLLANSDHVALWQFCIRIARFWLRVTAERPPRDRVDLAAYCPDLSTSHACGWLDIVYLSSMIVLLPCLDLRNFSSDGTPEEERLRSIAVCTAYKLWRQEIPARYECHGPTGELAWEEDVFSPCLLHLASVVWRYHQKTSVNTPDSDFKQRLQDALSSYDKNLGKKFSKNSKDGDANTDTATNFFLFTGDELHLVPRVD